MYEQITPVDKFGDFYVKREDLAFWHSLDYPSGSKVRQYMKMAGAEGVMPIPMLNDVKYPPCIVGCSANSCQQIYVAATAKILGTKGIIYVPKRRQRTSATEYCEFMGAEIHEVKPGYLSVIRARAKARARELGQVVGWNPELAIEDTAAQCANIPDDVKRIIVASGSGLTAAGILRGLARLNRSSLPVIAVATSSQGSVSQIISKAKVQVAPYVVPPTSRYDKYEIAYLPDGTPLDPFYGAKAFRYLQKNQQQNDMLWVPGLRPVRSMPEGAEAFFRSWKGPK
jgi:1-aminocyclopropane-1-carboxylate deaminase/D-cysteine desulfhydrase-like pyridoxal-dependent ACC family enzyme